MHYTWLCTFTLLNALSYRMCQTFTDLTFNQLSMRKNNALKYILYAWLSPLSVIIPCIVFDLIGVNWFQYGDANNCWISNVRSHILLYSFAFPVTFLIVINIILLVRCALSLYVTIKDISFDYRVNQQQIFRTYSCLFVISGATWLLGFLPTITGNDVFWYPFVIANAFQGFFIFLIFGLPHIKCKI